MSTSHTHVPLIKIIAKAILNTSRCRTNTHCSDPTAHVRYHNRTRHPSDSRFLKDLAACYIHLALPPSDPRLSPSNSALHPSELALLPRVNPRALKDLVYDVLNCKYGWGNNIPETPPMFKELAEWKPRFRKVTAGDLERLFDWMRRHDGQWLVHVGEYPERWRRRAVRMYREWENPGVGMEGAGL